MDLVYTYKYDSRNGNDQLRYSLRSVEKHLKGISRVIVVGFDPKLNGEILHVEAKDNFSPARNIMQKIFQVCEFASEEFLYMADDHYFLADTDAKTYPYYTNGTLTQLARSQKPAYARIIQNTYEALTLKGKMLHNFNIHCPIRYNRDKFREIVSLYDKTPLGVLSKSIYGNHFDLYDGNDMKDCKIKSVESMNEWDRRVEGRHIFSTGKEFETPAIMEKLKELYPNKSVFEK